MIARCVICGKRIWWPWQMKLNDLMFKNCNTGETRKLNGPMHTYCGMKAALQKTETDVDMQIVEGMEREIIEGR